MNALIHPHGHHPHQQHPIRTRNSNSLSVYSLNETGVGRLIFNEDYTEFDGVLVNFQDELYQVSESLIYSNSMNCSDHRPRPRYHARTQGTD